MPIYEDESTTIAKLLELRRQNRCQVCGEALGYLALEDGFTGKD